MSTTEAQQLQTLIANAPAFGQRVRVCRRFNGAVEGCPEVFQIQVGRDLHGWFETRKEANQFKTKALSK